MSEEQIKSIIEEYIDCTEVAGMCLNQAAAEIMKLMQGWVSVEDALPELPKPYYDKETGYMMKPVTDRVIVFDGEDVYEESFDEEGFRDDSITHWMPLPQPPLTPKSTDQ